MYAIVYLNTVNTGNKHIHAIYSAANSSLIFAIASAGFRPFGQVREPVIIKMFRELNVEARKKIAAQLKIVWHR